MKLLFYLQRLMFWKHWAKECPSCGSWKDCFIFIHYFDEWEEYSKCPTCGKVIRVESLYD